MDKGAKILRDTFNISYMAALQLKRRLFADPAFQRTLAEGRTKGRLMPELLVEAARPIIDTEFEPDDEVSDGPVSSPSREGRTTTPR